MLFSHLLLVVECVLLRHEPPFFLFEIDFFDVFCIFFKKEPYLFVIEYYNS